MTSTLFVEEIKGRTTGTNANKVIVPSGQTLEVPTVTGNPSFTGGLKVNTIKHTGGTTAMTIDSGGRILTPTRIMFDVNKTSEQTVASSTINKVEWETENYDIGGGFDLSNNRFIAPIAGKYFMSAYVTLGTMVAGSGIGLQWFKNGSIFRHGHHQSTEINITIAMSCSTTFDLAKDDYIEIFAFHGSGSNQGHGVANNVGTGSIANSNYWTGHLIG